MIDGTCVQISPFDFWIDIYLDVSAIALHVDFERLEIFICEAEPVCLFINVNAGSLCAIVLCECPFPYMCVCAYFNGRSYEKKHEHK